MLSQKCITLLEPNTWEDRNDAFYLEKYKNKKNLATLLAYCFSSKRETFHHWKVFAGGSSGVCVEFRKIKLMDSVRNVHGIRTGKVKYRLIKENSQPSYRVWPFLKRVQFKDEGEFRIIYENTTHREKAKDIQIDLSCISKITLSPWMPRPLSKSTAGIIKKIEGCCTIDIRHSTLLDSADWQKCLNRQSR
jgi:hypothetical protein